jgi:hypothetical protein
MDTINHIRTSLTTYITAFRRININKAIFFYPAALVGAFGSVVFARAAWTITKSTSATGPAGCRITCSAG